MSDEMEFHIAAICSQRVQDTIRRAARWELPIHEQTNGPGRQAPTQVAEDKKVKTKLVINFTQSIKETFCPFCPHLSLQACQFAIRTPRRSYGYCCCRQKPKLHIKTLLVSLKQREMLLRVFICLKRYFS